LKDATNTNLYKIQCDVKPSKRYHKHALERQGNNTIFNLIFQNFLSLWERTPSQAHHNHMHFLYQSQTHASKTAVYTYIRKVHCHIKDIHYNYIYCHINKMLAQSSNIHNYHLLHCFSFVFIKILPPVCQSRRKPCSVAVPGIDFTAARLLAMKNTRNHYTAV
jgi:hypothetical protein